jgi:L-malate glycosyltransferase
MAANGTINICQIASGDLWAGAEVQMYTLASSLSLIPEVNLLCVVLNEGKLSEKLRQADIKVIVIDERVHSFAALRNKLVAVLDGQNIDIIHSHRYKENLLAAWVKRKCHIKYLVQTVHGIDERRTGLRKLKSDVTSLINRHYSRKHFDKVIAVSAEIKQQLEASYRPDQLVMIHNCIDTAKVTPTKLPALMKAELNIPDDALVIGSVGRMVPIKGYEIFLQMAKLLTAKRRDLVFILAGDGPLLDELEKMAADLGLRDQVKFLGFREDILDIVNCLDIFVMSSYHEGIPIALLEAMALNKAVVSTAVGGIMEVLEDGVSGLLVKSGDPIALADACEKVLGSAELRRLLGNEAAKRVKQEFSIESQLNETFGLYRELMERR